MAQLAYVDVPLYLLYWERDLRKEKKQLRTTHIAVVLAKLIDLCTLAEKKKFKLSMNDGWLTMSMEQLQWWMQYAINARKLREVLVTLDTLNIVERQTTNRGEMIAFKIDESYVYDLQRYYANEISDLKLKTSFLRVYLFTLYYETTYTPRQRTSYVLSRIVHDVSTDYYTRTMSREYVHNKFANVLSYQQLDDIMRTIVENEFLRKNVKRKLNENMWSTCRDFEFCKDRFMQAIDEHEAYVRSMSGRDFEHIDFNTNNYAADGLPIAEVAADNDYDDSISY